MFYRKTVKRLKNQIETLTLENNALDGSNKSLTSQRDGLYKLNNELRKQISSLRSEYNETLEAKEIERQELCDQLGEAQDTVKKMQHEIETLKAKLTRKGCNKTQPRNGHGQFTKKETAH